MSLWFLLPESCERSEGIFYDQFCCQKYEFLVQGVIMTWARVTNIIEFREGTDLELNRFGVQSVKDCSGVSEILTYHFGTTYKLSINPSSD